MMGTPNTNSSKNAGVSSAIVGSFDPIEGMPDDAKNTWAFEYNKTQNTITFQIQVGITPMMIDNSSQNLHSEIQVEDIDQLINWLAIVKINSSAAKSNNSN
ncbi:hypothetical protein [Aurantivibrio plasticivorans]